jgi:para-nitrobenzyl esterase
MPYELDDAELGLSDTMIGYWSRMAASGDPNGAGASAWPPYDEASDMALGLDVEVTQLPALHAARCDFWDTLSLSL